MDLIACDHRHFKAEAHHLQCGARGREPTAGAVCGLMVISFSLDQDPTPVLLGAIPHGGEIVRRAVMVRYEMLLGSKRVGL